MQDSNNVSGGIVKSRKVQCRVSIKRQAYSVIPAFILGSLCTTERETAHPGTSSMDYGWAKLTDRFLNMKSQLHNSVSELREEELDNNNGHVGYQSVREVAARNSTQLDINLRIAVLLLRSNQK